MYKTILAAIDLEHGEHIQKIVDAAQELAKVNGAEVCLLTVVPAGPAIVSQFLAENYERLASTELEEKLNAMGAKLTSAGIKCSALVRFGTIYEEILAAAEKLSADLIIVGSHKPYAADFLLGTNAARVVRHADVSVFVVR